MVLIKDNGLQDCFLIATPSMGDSRFEKAVIYLFSHDSSGAMGIIINQLSTSFTFDELKRQLKIDDTPKTETLYPIYEGGPMETHKGFVLHTNNYIGRDTIVQQESGIALTSTIDIIKALAHNKGPSHALIALGYAGWAPMQLDQELIRSGWLYCPADADILFHTPMQDRWEKAFSKAGVSLGNFTEYSVPSHYMC